jgi:uncharacterized protein YjbI with pentapeptide repeats
MVIAPRRAPVRPRVLSEQTGDSLPLDAVLEDLLAGPARCLVRLTGPAGCGKTTALEHLAQVFAGRDILLIDEPRPDDLAALPPSRRVVFTSPVAEDGCRATHTYRLAPWRQDEWIEYLLAAHKERCASVMARLRSDAGLAPLHGNPQLCRLVLDQLATDESLPSARAALSKYLEERFSSPHSRIIAEKGGFDLLLGGSTPEAVITGLGKESDTGWGDLLRHRPLQLMLAAAYLLRDLQAKAGCRSLGQRLPRDLVREAGSDAARHPAVLDTLRAGLDGRPEWHAMAASILQASGVEWSPTAGSKLRLAGAYLGGASWPGVALPGVDLTETDLSSAKLQRANLDGARAAEANLRHADLCGASLRRFVASGADLARADLSRGNLQGGFFDGANLEGADLQGADLRGTSFTGANLTRACFREAALGKACLTGAVLDEADCSKADLSGAILSGLKLHTACFTDARFRGARLVASDLEGVELPGADFREADLQNALLTGSSMPGARFDGACLAGAGLAEVDWEGASLRGADLTGVSFHMGSTRCGLVGSPIACEGSRTGFYTDEYAEQDFKAPEEIRKANLSHADLRGARIDRVDFYLVDLRRARYDPHQERHLRRCGAILENRE